MMNRLKTGALLLLFFGLLLSLLPACGAQLVEFELDADGTGDAPVVVSTVPASFATAVALTSSVTATFSKSMDGATIGLTTFTLRRGGAPVSGAVTFDDATKTATFTPEASLARDQLYTATITTGVWDTEGRSLVVDYVWDFTGGNIAVDVTTTAAGSVPAPDYLLTVGGLIVLTDANHIVQSVTGEATLTAGLVTGQRYVVVDAAGLDTYAAIDGAYLGGVQATLTASIAATDFALVGADLTTSQVRTLVVANLSNDVRSYQAFEITFHPAH